MASVTKTITETVGDIQKTTSLYFTSFEDFMEYESVVNRNIADPMDFGMEDNKEDNEGWIENKGVCPVAGGVIVQVKFRDGFETEGTADCYYWHTSNNAAGDIIKYRIVEEI